MDGEKSFFDAFSPKSAFLAGLISAVLILCTIGFIVLLTAVLSGKNLKAASNGNGAGANAAAFDNGAGVPEGVGNFREIDEDRDHIRGEKNAKITIIEYSDLECPFCKQFHATMKNLVANNNGNVNWVYRHFPLDGLHRKARQEAESSECAAEQGKFWEYSDKIFEVTPSNDGLDLATLPDLAKQAGVKDIKKFSDCVSSKKYAQKVQEDADDANAAGGQGTPYSIILGTKGEKIPISGALPESSIQSAIDTLLEK